MVGEQYGAQVDQTARVFATQLDSTTDAQSVANALRQQIYTRPDLAMDLAQRIQQYEKGTSGLELSVNPILKEVRTANGVQYIDTGQAQINIMNADGTTVNVATVPSNRSGDALAGDAGYLNPDSQWAGSFPDQFSGFQGGPFGNFLPFGNFGGPFRHGSRNPIENMISGLLGRFIGQIGGFGGGNGWDYGDNWGGNYGQSPWLYQNPDYYQGSNWYPDSYYPNNYNVWNQNYYNNPNRQSGNNIAQLLLLQQMQRQMWHQHHRQSGQNSPINFMPFQNPSQQMRPPAQQMNWQQINWQQMHRQMQPVPSQTQQYNWRHTSPPMQRIQTPVPNRNQFAVPNGASMQRQAVHYENVHRLQIQQQQQQQQQRHR